MGLARGASGRQLRATRVRVITVTIPGQPPTPNARRHWRQIAHDNAVWKDAAWKAALHVKPEGWAPLPYVALEVVVIVPDKRHRDFDNAMASCKPLIDGLVVAGIMAGDSNREVDSFRVRFQYRKGVSAVSITVTELDPPEPTLSL